MKYSSRRRSSKSAPSFFPGERFNAQRLDQARRIDLFLNAAINADPGHLDSILIRYASLSEKGLILEANLTCATLLGAERGLLLGKPFSRFIAKDAQDAITTSFWGFS